VGDYDFNFFMNITISKRQTILLIITTLAIGVVVGVVVLIFFSNQGFLNKVQLSDLDVDQPLVIDSPRTVVVNQDVQIGAVENQVVPALVNIYNWRTSTTAIIDRALTTDRRVGQGVVLTADGWIVTSAKALSIEKDNYRAVGYQQKEYSFKSSVVDSAYGLAFAKVEGVNLPVASLGSLADVSVGQTAVLVGPRTASYVVRVVDITYPTATAATAVTSSDRGGKRIIIDQVLTVDNEGGVLVSLRGDVIGIVIDGTVIPIDYIKPVLSSIFEAKPIQRPLLSLDYIDLAHIDGFGSLGDRGALIVGAPVKTSPAFNLVRDGDLITKVNDIELNTNNGLADIINTYRSGQSIELLIKRATSTVPVVVKLK